MDLKAGGRGAGRRSTGAGVLAAVEVGLSVVLLIGVGLLVGTMRELSEIPVGFDTADAQAMRVPLTRERYATLEAGEPGARGARWSLQSGHGELARDVIARLEALPAVEAAGAVNILPMQDAFRSNHGVQLEFDWLDLEPTGPEILGTRGEGYGFIASATPGYFAAMGVPVLWGRVFTEADDLSAPLVAVVNQDIVDRYNLADPVGRRMRIWDGGSAWRTVEIVGVVGGVIQLGYHPLALEDEGPGFAKVYIPYEQPGPDYDRFRIDFHMTTNFVVRHSGNPTVIGAAMTDALRAADPELPVEFNASLEEYLAENLVDRRFQMLLIGVLAAIALATALVGVYGVMAFQVGQRVHEIGVRLALGARSDGVVGMIVGEGARIAILGVALGVAGAMGTTRLLDEWLYGVSPTEPSVFVALSLAMIAATVLACWIPARRAADVDPIETLKAE